MHSGWCREERAIMIHKLRCPLLNMLCAKLPSHQQKSGLLCVCVHCLTQHSGDVHSPINTHMQGYMQKRK